MLRAFGGGAGGACGRLFGVVSAQDLLSMLMAAPAWECSGSGVVGGATPLLVLTASFYLMRE